ncbi:MULTISPECIES: ArsC/Spx/MgsR family protein [unclassified Olleya]|jgi:arsenate reductase|uniref:arsenate reductase family protein n=1 Tax=unclassified Olleya TaxID=2615019 RepID=UPI0025E69205|nr:ArsC/Spx/MgsR family protein [Olleya sp. UBA1516]|tara:strand:- start:5352 stop:5708 length:357 start_codon:yes stop_codon:yes gene_type:complete
MKKVYYLKTCSTCLRILKELNLPSDFELQDIKANPLTVKQVEDLAALSGSYEALFSKRAKLYKEMGLKDQNLTEKDYKHYLLEHYTFLSRPVVVIDQSIFIGNSKKTTASTKLALNEN